MNKQLKRKWVEALESGKYRRADGQLKKGRGYCCLGVLDGNPPGYKEDKGASFRVIAGVIRKAL